MSTFGDNKCAVYKRTIDSAGGTRGEHDNFLTGAAETPIVIAERLLPHLVTRLIITGAGLILPDHPSRYVLDQKVWDLGGNPVSSSTTTRGNKPFIIDREGHYGTDGMRRLQIASSNANLFAFPVAARILMAGLVLRLIEQNVYPGDLVLGEVNYAHVAQHIAGDRDLEAKVELKNGKHYTAAQLQHELAARALKLSGLPEDEKTMAGIWFELSGDLIDHNLDPWTYHLEWLAKLLWLEKHKRESGSWRDAKVMEREIKWHRLSTDGVVAQLRRAGRIAMMPSEDAITAAMGTPPDPTRAQLRSRFITEHRKNARGVNWHTWRVAGGKTTLAYNPYQSTDV